MSENALATLNDLMGFDMMAEYEAQAQSVKEPPKAYVNPNAGKLRIKYAKMEGKFSFPNPADLDKPEDERTAVQPKKLRGMIGLSRFNMRNWQDGDDGKRRLACRSVSFLSKAIDPATRQRKIVDGDPMMTESNKWNFVRSFELQAERRVATLAADGSKTYNKMNASCLSCMEKEKEDPESWFKTCDLQGEFDFVVTHIGDKPVAEPFIGVLNLPRTSMSQFHEYLQKAMKMYDKKMPYYLLTQMEVEIVQGEKGSYERLVFSPIGDSTDEQHAVMTHLYNELKKAQADGAGDTSRQLSEAKPEPTKATGSASAGDRPF